MQIYIMLTVDLNNRVTEEAREKFNEVLKENQWVKLKLTTTWWARFTEGVTGASALVVTKQDVKNAAAAAGVTNYEAAAEVGYSEPTIWNQVS